MRIFVLALCFVFLSPASVLAADYDTASGQVFNALIELQHGFPEWRNNFEAHVFDCSEMSSFVHDFLEYKGIPCDVVAGQNIDATASHAWVEVPCDDGVIVIESTTLQYGSTETEVNNFLYPNRYDPSIFSDTEWDWWNDDYLIGQESSGPVLQALSKAEAREAKPCNTKSFCLWSSSKTGKL